MISQLWIIIAVCAAITILFVFGATLLFIQHMRQERSLEGEDIEQTKKVPRTR